jgi:transcriptional regulator with XRE-family HTH domain
MIGKKIKEIRRAKKINKSELARITGLERRIISSVENDSANYTKYSLLRICNALDIEIILKNTALTRKQIDDVVNVIVEKLDDIGHIDLYETEDFVFHFTLSDVKIVAELSITRTKIDAFPIFDDEKENYRSDHELMYMLSDLSVTANGELFDVEWEPIQEKLNDLSYE